MSAVECEAPSRPVSPGAVGLQPGAAAFVWGVWAVMLVLALVYVGKFGSRLPFYDDWDVVPVLTGAEPMTLAYLWEPYHSHCMPLPKLALVSLTRLSGLDFRVAKFFHVALFGALSVALLLTVRRQRGRHEFADAFLPLFVLGLAQWECYLLPSCINLIFTAVIAGVYLVLLAGGGPRVSGRRAVLMAGCLALLPLCSAAGLALVPALTLWLAPVGILHCRAADAPSRRQGWLVLALIAIALVLSGLSFLSLQQPGQVPAPHEPAKILACARQVLNMLFGAPVPPFATRTAAVVLLLISVSGGLWLAAWWRQPGERLALLGFLAFSLGMGCLVGAIARGRVDYLATAGFIPRYATLQLPLGCCLYVFWGRYGGRCAPTAQMVLLLVAAVTFAPNLRDAWENGDSRRQALQTFEADLSAGLSPAQLAERGAGHVYWAEGKDDFARYLLMLCETHPAAYGRSHQRDESGGELALRLSPAAPVPKDKPKALLYHPTRVGAKWVYQSGDRESVEVVTEVQEKGDAKLVAVGYESRGKVTPNRVVSVSDGGICIVDFCVADLTEPFWLLKMPHAPGNKWEPVLAAEQWGRVTGAAKTDGPEPVEVPAGTYQAIRVRLELPHIDGREGKVQKSVWYAPGVGKVKEVAGERVELLKSFDPGKE